ncbi:hypothetical protein AB0Y20_00800 [Heyndrickxia oleronia]|uniref:hypothetical protein n=1 Tax=Heyndrickxia oleronia TaxID=38875 RepID=UPI003F283EA9
MDKFRLKRDDVCVVNENVKKFYPSRFDTKVKIVSPILTSLNYDYEAETEEGELLKFRDCELTKLNKDDWIVQLRKGQKVVYTPTNEIVTVEQISLLYGQVGIKFSDGGSLVVGIEVLRDVGKVPNLKNIENNKSISVNNGEITPRNVNTISTGTIINVFLSHYKNSDHTYTLPENLLERLVELAFKEGK